jgi:hypothetical protein
VAYKTLVGTAASVPGLKGSQPPTPPAYAPVVPDVTSESTLSHLERLSAAAHSLNQLSDELTKQVLAIEETLNKLNLGVEAKVNGPNLSESEDGLYTHWLRISYGKLAGKWGLLVEELSEDVQNSDRDSYAGWAFKDAPRDYRMKVVDKIPELLEALCKKSVEVAAEINKKVQFARTLVSTISAKPQPPMWTPKK